MPPVFAAAFVAAYSAVMNLRARPRTPSRSPPYSVAMRVLALQAQLAILYGKSRSAISKILRPENISKLKDISDTGVHKGTYLPLILIA